MPGQIRRSRRARVANQRYARDDWDEDTRQMINDSDSGSNHGDTTTRIASDDEFVQPNRNPASAIALSESESDPASSGVEDFSQLDDEAKVKATPPRSTTTKKAVKQTATNEDKGPNQHIRGLPTIDRKAGKASVFHDTFGPGTEEVHAVLEARGRWHVKARDSTIPSRETLQEALRKEWSTLIATEQISQATGNISKGRQNLTRCSLDSLQSEHFLPLGFKQRVVLGPLGRERLVEIDHLDGIDFGQAWEQEITGNESPANQPEESSASKAKEPSHRYHEGWLLNVGEKVNSLSWCPSRSSQPNNQYLAIACRSTQAQRQQSDQSTVNRSRAFSPSAGYPSSILIWRLPCRKHGSEGLKTLDFGSKPRLSHVVATQIGDVMQIAWLPDNDDHRADECSIARLAILSTDGCFRITEVPLPQTENDPAPFTVKMEEAALCIKPPDEVVFSTFTLASSSDLIIGASDGEVRLFNLDQCRSSPTCEPYMTVRLHHTYIMGLVTAGNGRLSHFLASSSAAGDMRLTDLRAPYQDTILVPRSRLPTRNLAYCPLTQSFITTVDHSGRTEVQAARTTVSAHQLRHFYSQVLLTKFPNNTGTASALAASPLHPYILVGNTQGTVQCQNIFKKLLPRGGRWVQKLCDYEWRREDTDNANDHIMTDVDTQRTSSTPDTTEEAEPIVPPSSLYYGNDVQPGLSRFREGFVLEKQDLAGPPPGQAKRPTKKKRRRTSNDTQGEADSDEEGTAGTGPGKSDEAVAEVIFEEENAVTAMCWNSNPSCAPWIAVGWGSGLVRIQDLSHDMK